MRAMFACVSAARSVHVLQVYACEQIDAELRINLRVACVLGQALAAMQITSWVCVLLAMRTMHLSPG